MLNDPRSHGLWEKTAPPPATDIVEPGFRAVKEMRYEAGAQAAHFVGART